MENPQMTRSGIKPDTSALRYNINTRAAEEFINKRFGALQSVGQNDKVLLYTASWSDKFSPFVVIMPMSVLKQRPRKNNNGDSDALSMFTRTDNDNNGRTELLRDVFELMKMYMYTSADESALMSKSPSSLNSYRENFKLSYKNVEQFRSMRKPQVIKTKNGGRYVAVLIDPVALFTDMLATDGNGQETTKLPAISIKKITKITDGEASYEVERRNSHFESANRGFTKDDIVSLINPK